LGNSTSKRYFFSTPIRKFVVNYSNNSFIRTNLVNNITTLSEEFFSIVRIQIVADRGTRRKSPLRREVYATLRPGNR